MISDAQRRTIDRAWARRRVQAVNRSSLPSNVQADMRQHIANVERIVYLTPTQDGTLYWCDEWAMEVME